MKEVGIALVKGLALWLAASAVAAIALHAYGARPTAAVMGGLIGTAIAWIPYRLFLTAFVRWNESAAIHDSLAGVPPVDGKQTVIVGTLEALEDELVAPLDGARCLAYTYEIRNAVSSEPSRSRQDSFGTIARGRALAPSHIVNSVGTYKLLSLPQIDGVAARLTNDQCISRFLTYARNVSFIDADGAAKEFESLWRADGDRYRADVRLRSLESSNTHGWQAQQHSVPPGAQVGVFGRYSASRGAIVPNGLMSTRLIVGDAAELGEKLRRQALTYAAIGVAIVSAIALISWLNMRPHAGEKVFRTVKVRAASGPICVELSRRTKLFEPQSRLLSHHRLQ